MMLLGEVVVDCQIVTTYRAQPRSVDGLHLPKATVSSRALWAKLRLVVVVVVIIGEFVVASAVVNGQNG